MLKIYYQRQYADGKSVHKKMLSIINHLRNANRKAWGYTNYFLLFSLKN